MVGQPRLYAAAAVAACLGALALSVASAWSQAPTGGVTVPPAPVTSGSGGAAAGPDPAPTTAAVPRLARETPLAVQPQPPKTPEHRQELEQQVPLEHLKPTPPVAAPAPAPAPPPTRAPSPAPALAPVGALAGALPNTGVEPLTLVLTGLALVSMGVSFRAAAALRRA